MQNHLKIAAVLFFFCFSAMIFGITKNQQSFFSLSRGNYFFDNTRNSAHLKIIRIKFGDGETISLKNKNRFWRIEEADDYYAAFQKINSFLGLIHNTMIYRADALRKQDEEKFVENTVQITTFDDAGNILDEVLIAPKSENNKYHYAMLNQNNFLYQLTENFNLSSIVMDWVQAPLLQIDYNRIRRIKSGDFEVYREIGDKDLKLIQSHKTVPHIKRLVNNLWYLSPEDIRHAVHFDRQKFKLVKTFEITTLGGMIYRLNFFGDGKEYWLNISLDRELIISHEDAHTLRENGMLYDGWYFKIGFDTGEAIDNFSI